MKKKYKAAIIGLGNIGFRYTLDPRREWISSHLEAYILHTDFEPVAVCDVNNRRLKAAGNYYPKLKLYTSWDEMVAREDLDILSVCVSPEVNYDVSCAGAISKLKAIIFEKPLAKDKETARLILNNLKKAKVHLVVNHFRRWQGIFLKLKQMIDSGLIGKIQKVNGYYATALFNGGIHLIDTLQYLLGAFTEIRALARTKFVNQDDFAYSAFGKINDIEAFITGFNKSDYNIFEIEIWGDKGRLFVDDFGTRIGLQKATSSRRFSAQKELRGVKEFKSNGLGSNFTNLLDNLASVLRHQAQAQLLCSAEDALQTIAVAESIVTSYNLGGSIITIRSRGKDYE